MDDEFSDMFLLNDCLISGRLSPGPPDAPDDFFSQESDGGMLLAQNDHIVEVPASFLCFDGEPDLGYPNSESPRRLSTIPASTAFRKSMDRLADDGGASFFTYVKTEDPSPISGRSPDHDYINDVRMEGIATENGCSGGIGNVCSSKTASSMEYCRGTVGEDKNDNGIKVKYDVDEYYSDYIETKPLTLHTSGDPRIVSSSVAVSSSPTIGIGSLLFTTITSSGLIASATDASLISVGETECDTVATKSVALDRDRWPCGPVLSREDDAVPSGDDNSSTTSSDSCSNCGYLSSGSPTPNHKHGAHIAYSSHPQGNGVRYRSGNSSGASALNLNLRTRSKMHELAVKHRLISEQDPRSKGYVLLSPEERRTLVQEGLPVPTKLPLSKQEEEALKIVRRKIKNKLSAQESRRKRKEYMETLEQQIEGYQSENSSLRRRIDALEKSNQSLLGQLKKLQQQFTPASSPTSATLIVTNSHGSSFDSTTSSRGNSNVHTVSLAAMFLLFAVMIPAMPIWPAVFRNAFITSPMMAKSSNFGDVTVTANAYFDHSHTAMDYASTRILSSGGGYGDCEIPYSAEYFEKLNECRPVDPIISGEMTKEAVTVFYSAMVNHTGNLGGISQSGVGSTTVCETSFCRGEALVARKMVAHV